MILLRLLVVMVLSAHHTLSEYVPLNSLTISSLYKDNVSQQKKQQEKPWWTDLQEKHEQYRAEKLRRRRPNNEDAVAFVQNVPQGLDVTDMQELPQQLSRPINGITDRQTGQEIPFPSDFEELFSSKSGPSGSIATIVRVTLAPDKYRQKLTTQKPARSTMKYSASMSTLRQSADTKSPPPTRPTRLPQTTTSRKSSISLMPQPPPTTTSRLPMTSLIKNHGVIHSANVPGGPYARMLFDKFMAKLQDSRLKIPFRHIKIVFFNLLSAIGRSTDERRNQELLNAYLGHFKKAVFDDEKRFSLSDNDFKQTSELLDRLIFSYISDKFAFATTTTTAMPHLMPITERTTRKSVDGDNAWELPPLERVTSSPIDDFSSTATFGGVASNTARPTTKSVLAELEFPSNFNKPKFQFMHDPAKHKVTVEKPARAPVTTRAATKATTTQKPMPPFYPQLVQASQNQSTKHQFPVLRPNFNNRPSSSSSTTTTKKPMKNPLSMLLFGQGLEDVEVSPEFPTTTPTAITNSNITLTQWNLIMDKLNYALQKLSAIENKENMKKPDPDILDNPQYLNNKAADNNTDLVINVLSYDEEDAEDPEHDINYSDYFQAILDADNISLDEIKQQPGFSTAKPTQIQFDDYLYLDRDDIEDLFNVDIPIDDNEKRVMHDLPGVGSKNPVPLSNFPNNEEVNYLPDLGRFPVQIPAPVADDIIKKRRPPNVGSIGTRPTKNDRIKGKTKLTVPGVIKRIFGPPPNITDLRAAIPDFTSSGPVNIPSPLQLYGNIGRYLNRTTTTTTTARPPANIQPGKESWPENKLDPAFVAALAEILDDTGKKRYPTRHSSPFKLPSQSALPKPQSLVKLEADRRPVPVQWLDDRYQSSTSVQDLERILLQLNQNVGMSQRFKSPPVMLPNVNDATLQEERFTILTPQALPQPFRTGNVPKTQITTQGKKDIFDMVLRHQSLPLRKKRSSGPVFVLKPPPALDIDAAPDEQLKPQDAVAQILQDQPQDLPPTSAIEAVAATSNSGQTVLQKPSALVAEEAILAQPVLASQISFQTSLLGASTNSIATNSSSISYNKLLIAAALSIVPTLVVAFPFVAASLSKRKRRRRRRNIRKL